MLEAIAITDAGLETTICLRQAAESGLNLYTTFKVRSSRAAEHYDVGPVSRNGSRTRSRWPSRRTAPANKPTELAAGAGRRGERGADPLFPFGGPRSRQQNRVLVCEGMKLHQKILDDWSLT